MILSPAIEETLVGVASILKPARSPWWVIGSAAMALHGVDPGTIADVDVLLDPADARAVLARLGLCNDPQPAGRFRSEVFARWEASSLPVEFMAGFAVRHGADWRAVEPITRSMVTVRGARVAVPALIELRQLFERFGREKDRARIRLLDEAGRGPGSEAF